MHMICDSTDADRLYFILLCDSTHERPKSFLDFAHQQRLAVFGAKNTVNMKRRECIGHGPSLISIVPPGRDQILNTNTGDKSPAYSLVVPPGHTGTATALNPKMSKLQGPSGRREPRIRHSKRRQTPNAQTTGTSFPAWLDR
jgi:hypothetical protein